MLSIILRWMWDLIVVLCWLGTLLVSWLWNHCRYIWLLPWRLIYVPRTCEFGYHEWSAWFQTELGVARLCVKCGKNQEECF